MDDLWRLMRLAGARANNSIWTSRMGTPLMVDVIWVEEFGKFIGVGLDSTVGSSGAVWYSANGTNWTKANSLGGVSVLTSISWSPQLNRLVIVSDLGDTMYSSDGITWTIGSSGLGRIQSVCWSPEQGKFVAVRWNTSTTQTVLLSTDGISWSIQNSPCRIAQSVVWAAALGLYVCVGEGTSTFPTRIATSPDGINWTARLSTLFNLGEVKWIAELNMLIATVPYGGVYYTSADGINWTERMIPTTTPLSTIGWNATEGLLYSLGNGSITTTVGGISRDGISWTPATAPIAPWSAISWSPSLNVLVGVQATATSPNVITIP